MGEKDKKTKGRGKKRRRRKRKVGRGERGVEKRWEGRA